MIEYSIDPNRCRGCGLCARKCPQQAIQISDGHAHILSDRCQACGVCQTVCRNGAIFVMGAAMSTEKASRTPDWRLGRQTSYQRWRKKHRAILSAIGLQ